ncbi:MAG: diphosphomevalonate decarboxylase [Chlorobi bacterium]|nr:diphosphomevalonate decarboxylase [Chlorobiota bacterium]
MPRLFHPEDFLVGPVPENLPENPVIYAEAPSNIALIKYWGKQKNGVQLPMNPSVSLTLSRSKTLSTARLKRRNEKKGSTLIFKLDGERKSSFEPKILTFLERIRPYAPFVNAYDWEIESRNTFPHGSGIASSASGFAALAKIVMDLEEQIYGTYKPGYRTAKTSFLARLGSGSAARSVAAPAMLWGKHPEVAESSDYYAIPLPFALHPAFEDIRDTIILFERGEKSVSSTQGHRLLENHPFKNQRISQAFNNMTAMLHALQTGDWDHFGRLTEAEALMLHALMMTSEPYFILMKPQTLGFIQDLWQWRKSFENSHGEKPPVYFTLDAGANVHLLYSGPWEERVMEWLGQTVPEIIREGLYIADRMARK